jgi:hypothetical protein
MKTAFLMFAIPSWGPRTFREWFLGRRKQLYTLDFESADISSQDGSKGIIFCEVGSTPVAPAVMTLLDDGNYRIDRGVLYIETTDFNLQISVSILKSGEAIGKLDHQGAGKREVKVVFATD